MTKLILGNITFENNTATIHEIKGVLLCETLEQAEKIGEDLCNIFGAYIIPDIYKGSILNNCNHSIDIPSLIIR